MESLTLLILAAGAGNRYGGLKQIDTVGPAGETIIDYSIYDAIRAGFNKVVFVIRREIEDAFRNHIGRRFGDRTRVLYAFQELDGLPPGYTAPNGRTKPWGTVQAVLAAADLIHEPFAVINADDFYGAESYLTLAKHLQSASPNYAMVGFTLRNTISIHGPVARGVCQVNDDGDLKDIVELTQIAPQGNAIVNISENGETTPLTGDELVSMNMWGFTPAVFHQLNQEFQRFLSSDGSDLKVECYLPTAIQSLVATREAVVKVLRTNASWFGMTYRADRIQVADNIDRLIRKGVYPEKLWR